ncbi:MAG: sulfatase [Bacteroidota bacterium]
MRHPFLFLKLICFSGILLLHCSRTLTLSPEQPNILWIVLEDTSPLLSCYGSTVISTPNIDRLANSGILFHNAFMPAPVCSASRSSIITGMMSTTLGLHNHHSSRTDASAIHLPDSIQSIPELFRHAGYFTFNNGKDDYNFAYDRRELYDQPYAVHPLYGKRGDRFAIAELPKHSPFFGQIQLSGGKEIFSSSFKEKVLFPVDREQLQLPPYLPNHPDILEEYANHLDAIKLTDEKIGQLMDSLTENQLLENTIIFFFSDHGMRMARHKQFLYDGGIHVPLIIADFRPSSRIEAATTTEQLISGIDIGPTSLALAGISIPTYMEGRDIFDQTVAARSYVISTRDRCDFTIDRIRAVRSKRFKYIRNCMIDRPYTQPTYMDVDGVPFVNTMKQLALDNKLDSIQARFYAVNRPVEELYDLQNDPFEIQNLAQDPAYQDSLKKYANILDQWILDTDDKGQYPESEAGLALMLGIWGAHAINPEYEPIKKKHPELAGSLFSLKSESWKNIKE